MIGSRSKSMRISCPTCEKVFDAQDVRTAPFCSERCQQVDLGRWLGEQYSVPVQRINDDELELEEPSFEGN